MSISILSLVGAIILFFMVVLLVIRIFFYGGILRVKHFALTKFGLQTTGRIIHSERCDDSEDVCVCGIFRYHDHLKWEHKVKFRFCWHWPSNEEWDKVMQSYGLDAENPVYYLPWFPFIHEIQFNIDNNNVENN